MTSCIFNSVSGKLGMLVIIGRDHKIVMSTASSSESAVISVTPSLPEQPQSLLSVAQGLVTCNQLDIAVGGTLSEITER